MKNEKKIIKMDVGSLSLNKLDSLNEELDLLVKLKAYDKACKDDHEIRSLYSNAGHKDRRIQKHVTFSVIVLVIVCVLIAYNL